MRVLKSSLIIILGMLICLMGKNISVNAAESDFVVKNGVLIDYIGNSEKIEIPVEITSIGDSAFEGNLSIVSVTIPSSVESIGEKAFSGCTKLAEIEIPSEVKNIGSSAFDNTIWLKKRVMRDNVVIVNGILISTEKSEKLELPRYVEKIQGGLFQNSSLQDIVEFPDSVVKIGENAFYGCEGIYVMRLPVSVSTIGDQAFGNCKNLLSITVPNSFSKISAGQFQGTRWLEDLRKNNELIIFNSKLVDAKSASGTVTIPDSITEIRPGAFADNTNVTKIVIPETVTKIGENAFNGCSKLKSFDMPETLTSFGKNAFTGTKWLADKQNKDPLVVLNGVLIDGKQGFDRIQIPDTVTKIGPAAFEGNTMITSVYINKDVTKIMKDAFKGCTALTKVFYSGSLKQFEKIGYSFDENVVIDYKSKKSDTEIYNVDMDEVTVFASSSLVEINYLHEAEFLTDGDRTTCWAEAVGGSGIGEYVEIQFGTEINVKEINILNGYLKNQDSFDKNGKVKKIQITYGVDGKVEKKLKSYTYQELSGKDFSDTIKFDTPVSTRYLRFTILNAEPGAQWDDTCISEIAVKAVY